MCRSVEVIRCRDRTVGVALALEPNFGEIGRTSFPVKQQASEVIKVNTNTNILWKLVSSIFVFQRTISFGDSVQDVMSSIGAPNRIFYKSEDKMKIHSPNAHRKASLLKSDYFYNYFTFGMVSSEHWTHSDDVLLFHVSGFVVRRQTQQGQEIHSSHQLPGSLQLQHVSNYKPCSNNHLYHC